MNTGKEIKISARVTEKEKQTIADVGLLNRIIVSPLENTADEYEIISGHRRVHAAELLGMKEVPAVVIPSTEMKQRF